MQIIMTQQHTKIKKVLASRGRARRSTLAEICKISADFGSHTRHLNC